MPAAKRLKLAVWKFASCDGCQLSLLDCEDELLALAEAVDIAHFLEASSAVGSGPYDLSLVEGSITTAHDAERIHKVRRISRRLVTIGACATAGGIQGLRNFAHVEDLVAAVYARPEYIATLDRSTPIRDHVNVDFELRGCPVNRFQLLDVVVSLLAGRRPQVPNHAECMECKRHGHVCVLVAHGTPCLGPVTQAGCGSLCPGVTRGCYGCFGPMEAANTEALAARLAALGVARPAIRDLFRSYNAAARPFRKESERHE